jgi:photosynthetic reaction center H subunit
MLLMTGAITEYIDVALLSFNVFFVLFVALVIYLHRESKREGYPLVYETDARTNSGLFGMPDPKTFRLADGTSLAAPRDNGDKRPLKAVQMQGGAGSPYVPTGNPLLDSIGPSSFAERRDVPDVTFEGHARIVPMRVARDFTVAGRDPDPRGMSVYGADDALAGKVADVWVDRSEYVIRYLEVELTSGGARVLLPINVANFAEGRVEVSAILAKQFSDVPKLKSPDRVTLLEEDKVMGYYGGGYLYATPDRQEPIL